MIYTKDERFLLRLYEMAVARGDPKTPLNREEVGASIKQSMRTVRTICVLLAQANFIEKESDDKVYLTDHGIKLVKQLLAQKK